MTVAKFTQPNYLTQTAAAYKAAIDAAIAVLATTGGDYACHAKDTPDMQVLVDAGQLFLANSTLVSNAQQTSATIVAPTTNPRIDRIVINDQTGVVSVITGTQAASPTAPAITAGTRPIAQILLQTSSTVITNSMITDERVVSTFDVSTFIRTFLDDADAATARNTLGAPGLTGNTFTGAQIISAAVPQFRLNETGSAVDNGLWAWIAGGEIMYLRAVNDAQTVSGNILTVNRTGTTIDTVEIGGATAILTGGQIKFPATQSASTNENTLDDYEEGSWTPSLGGTATYTAQSGTYTKIGRQVTITGFLTVNIIGTGNTSTIGGLPFPAAGVSSVTIGYAWGLANAFYGISGYTSGSDLIFALKTALGNNISNNNTVFGNAADIRFSCTYEV